MKKEDETETQTQTKTKPAETARKVEPGAVLDQMILDTQTNKYNVIFLATRWAHELNILEPGKHSVQELIAQSLGDILSKKVDAKKVLSLPPMPTLKKQKPFLTSSPMIRSGSKIIPENGEKKQ